MKKFSNEQPAALPDPDSRAGHYHGDDALLTLARLGIPGDVMPPLPGAHLTVHDAAIAPELRQEYATYGQDLAKQAINITIVYHDAPPAAADRSSGEQPPDTAASVAFMDTRGDVIVLTGLSTPQAKQTGAIAVEYGACGDLRPQPEHGIDDGTIVRLTAESIYRQRGAVQTAYTFRDPVA